MICRRCGSSRVSVAIQRTPAVGMLDLSADRHVQHTFDFEPDDRVLDRMAMELRAAQLENFDVECFLLGKVALLQARHAATCMRHMAEVDDAGRCMMFGVPFMLAAGASDTYVGVAIGWRAATSDRYEAYKVGVRNRHVPVPR